MAASGPRWLPLLLLQLIYATVATASLLQSSLAAASIPTPKRMTNLLNQAENMKEVLQLAESYGDTFNDIHMSAACMKGK